MNFTTVSRGNASNSREVDQQSQKTSSPSDGRDALLRDPAWPAKARNLASGDHSAVENSRGFRLDRGRRCSLYNHEFVVRCALPDLERRPVLLGVVPQPRLVNRWKFDYHQRRTPISLQDLGSSAAHQKATPIFFDRRRHQTFIHGQALWIFPDDICNHVSGHTRKLFRFFLRADRSHSAAKPQPKDLVRGEG